MKLSEDGPQNLDDSLVLLAIISFFLKLPQGYVNIGSDSSLVLIKLDILVG